jgi:hypothetical protein
MSITALNIATINNSSGDAESLELTPAKTRGPLPFERIREAVSPALLFGHDPEGYRPISGGRISQRDLNPVAHNRMQQVAYYLYLVNPLARRIVEYTKNYVVGDGVTARAADPAVNAVIQRFWNDPVNRMDFMLPESVRELSVFGEQCWLVAVNPVNGQVRLGYLDPSEIEAIEWGEMSMGDSSIDSEMVVSAPVAVLRKSRDNKPPRRFRIIRVDEDPASPTFGRLTGECFYFAVNKARNASRGISDLFAISDYLDGYDKMLFGLIDRVGFSNAFIWDVLMKGATEDKIQEWLKEQKPPRPGSVRVHNEQVEWKAVSPTLNAGDFNEAARTIKNMNLAGAGFPEHWFAEGGNVNRASALEMGEPTLKNLIERQGLVTFMVRQAVEFAIDQAVSAGALRDDVDRSFDVKMPQLSVRDMTKAASAVAQVASAVVSLRQAELIDHETARQMIAAAVIELGVELPEQNN